MRSLPLACLFLLLGLLAEPLSAATGGGAGYGGNNNNNVSTTASVDGQKFDILVTPEGKGKGTMSMVLFRAKDCSCDYLSQWNITSLPYTETPKGSTAVSFDAGVSDADGNSLKMTGSVTNGAITGSIAVHQAKGNQTSTYNFHGGSPGSPESAAAKKEAAESVGRH